MGSVLIIEDDVVIRNLLEHYLSEEGWKVDSAAGGLEALEKVQHQEYHLINLDLRLPDIYGMKVLMQMREWTSAPVIVVSAVTDEAEKIALLRIGADDYITKPFSAGEFKARVAAVMRRSGPRVPSLFICEGFIMDFDLRKVIIAGREVALLPKEYDLLREFVQNPGKTFTRENLLTKFWGLDCRGSYGLLYPQISRIRAKIEPDPHHPRYIIDVERVGYCFRTSEARQ